MQKIIIWDLDGTILDSLGVFEETLKLILPQHGLPLPSVEVMAANFHGSLEDSIAGVLGNPEPELLAQLVADFLGTQDSAYAVVEPHLLSDALRLMQRAHEAGYRQILVTNRGHVGRLRASPRSIVANSDLKLYIDTVICGDDGEHTKPKPAVLGALADELRAADVLVVGDQHVDAEFALNLEARGVLVRRDGVLPVYMEALGRDWQQHVQVVKSLDEVVL
ncbi:MAG TPA: HAD family hydrolase [Candidatus Microsaccharimonas sp.]|nr:HAD family hydrolase [Candidatus Microsaccharimonas sp.]